MEFVAFLTIVFLLTKVVRLYLTIQAIGSQRKVSIAYKVYFWAELKSIQTKPLSFLNSFASVIMYFEVHYYIFSKAKKISVANVMRTFQGLHLLVRS